MFRHAMVNQLLWLSSEVDMASVFMVSRPREADVDLDALGFACQRSDGSMSPHFGA